MLRYLTRSLPIAVILTGFCRQPSDAADCQNVPRVLENFVYNNPSGRERCKQWKIPSAPKHQATLIRMNTNNPAMFVNVSHVGVIKPKYIPCVIYHPKKCVVSLRNCEAGSAQAISDSTEPLVVSVGQRGYVGISYEFLSCSDAMKKAHQTPAEYAAWCMAGMAILTFCFVIARVICGMCQSCAATTAETKSDGNELKMVKVETHRKESRMSNNEPTEEVTAFESKTNLDRNDTDDDDEDDESDKVAEQSNEGHGSASNITGRILDQQVETMAYASISDIIMRKKAIAERHSTDEQGGASSSEENDEDDTSEKNAEEQDSSDGETYKSSDVDEEKQTMKFPEKGEDDDDAKETDDEVNDYD